MQSWKTKLKKKLKEQKNLISLFDYTGNWSLPWRENGWNVTQVDIKLGSDINEFVYDDLVDVVLAAPPCTDFAVSGARWFREKDEGGQTLQSILLVKRTLEFIANKNPRVWAIENPVGRINTLLPELGKARLIFQPYDYGDPFRKRTCLWGKFNIPDKTPVEPLGVRKGQPDEWYSKVGGKSEKTKEYRSRTPMGFAWAFYKANNGTTKIQD